MKRRSFLCATLVLPFIWPQGADAAPRAYGLAPDSTVSFTYTLAGVPTKGSMPILEADLRLDFASVGRSQVSVTLDPTRARTTLPLADSAMRGPNILDTARYPTIRYASTSVKRTSTGAEITGSLRVRNIDRPVTLAARFFRQPDRDPADLSELVIELTGSLSRAAFGATGFADVVGDQIDLRMLATIARQK